MGGAGAVDAAERERFLDFARNDNRGGLLISHIGERDGDCGV